MPMEYIATRRQRTGETHKQANTRLFRQNFNNLMDKCDLQDVVIAKNQQIEQLEAKLPSMIQEALRQALATNQPAAVEDNSNTHEPER